MYNLFDRFPRTTFANNLAINILTSVKFDETAKKNSFAFYPYTIQEGERADIIAANYYDDARYAWVIYLCNNIVDPVYDWPMTTDEFKSFLSKKYGSIENALEKVVYYTPNWDQDDSIISPAAYEALSAPLKKYWQPITGINDVPVSYERKRLELAVETNKVVFVKVSNSSIFSVEQKVKQSNNTLTTTGFIKSISNNTLSIQHVEGEFSNSSNLMVFSIPSQNVAVTSVTNEITNSNGDVINIFLSNTEAVYWRQVSAYEDESNLNESKKNIRLLDKTFLDQLEKELSESL